MATEAQPEKPGVAPYVMDDVEIRSWVRKVWLGYAAMAVALAIAIYIAVHERDQRISGQSHAIQRIEMVAKKADSDASKALTQTSLKKEKICSDTNQDGACRDLFDRLANNLSPEQRRRLACGALSELSGNTIDQIRKASHCPNP